MNKTVAIMSAILTLTFVVAMAMAADMTVEERTIRREAQEFANAFNQGKADVLAAQWTKEGEYTIGHHTIKGREAIAKLYSDVLHANPGSKMEIKVASVRLVAPTVAIEDGVASVVGSANQPASTSSYSAVHVKEGDRWPMVSVRESESPTFQFNLELNELAWMIGKWNAGKEDTTTTLDCDWMPNKHFLRMQTTRSGKNGDLPGGTQIVARNPANGQLVSWFFNADGGFGSGAWQKQDSGWIIRTVGITADGVPTKATNSIHMADKNVASWQSFNRFRGSTSLPDIKEVVLERVQSQK